MVFHWKYNDSCTRTHPKASPRQPESACREGTVCVLLLLRLNRTNLPPYRAEAWARSAAARKLPTRPRSHEVKYTKRSGRTRPSTARGRGWRDDVPMRKKISWFHRRSSHPTESARPATRTAGARRREYGRDSKSCVLAWRG